MSGLNPLSNGAAFKLADCWTHWSGQISLNPLSNGAAFKHDLWRETASKVKRLNPLSNGAAFKPLIKGLKAYVSTVLIPSQTGQHSNMQFVETPLCILVLIPSQTGQHSN